MKPLLCLLTFALTSMAAGQAFSAEQFGRSLHFQPDTFEPAQTSTLLGQPLPREGIRIRSLSAVNANILKIAFTDAPGAFGYRCTGEQEVLLLPGTPDDARPFQLQVFRKAGIQPLYQTSKETDFSLGKTVFARLSSSNGVLLLTACRVTRDPVPLNLVPAAYEVYLGPSPYLLTGDFAGHLNWCTGTAQPMRTVQAFSGSALKLDVSQDGTRVAVGGWDATPAVKIYDAANGTLTQTLPLDDGPVALAFSSDAQTLLVLDAHQTYTWFEVGSGKVLKSWSIVSLLTPRLLGGASGEFLEAAMGSTLRVYDAQKGAAKFSLRNYKLSDQAFTADGKWIVTADLQGVLSAYSTVNGAPGPRTTVGALKGVGLIPGQSGSEVIVISRQETEGKPNQISASSWKVGEQTVAPRGTTGFSGQQYIVLNQARTTPASLAACGSP